MFVPSLKGHLCWGMSIRGSLVEFPDQWDFQFEIKKNKKTGW